MTLKKVSFARQTQLIKVAKQRVSRLGRASSLRRLEQDIKRLDKSVKDTQRRRADGAITKREAARTLASLVKMRREGRRLLVTRARAKESALAYLDRLQAGLKGGR